MIPFDSTIIFSLIMFYAHEDDFIIPGHHPPAEHYAIPDGSCEEACLCFPE